MSVGERRPVVVHVMGWRSQQYGSFERFLVALGAACRDAGADVHLVFPARPASRAFVADVAAQIHVLPDARGPLDAGYALGIRRILTGTRATHVHAHFGVEAYHALVMAFTARVPRRFFTKHITPGPANPRTKQAQLRVLAGLVDRFFAVSQQVADRMAELGVPPTKLDVSYLGVDPAVYRPDPQARAQVRAELGAGPGTRLILSASHLRPGKGVDMIPALAARLAEDPGNVLWLLAGDGTLREQIAAAARSLQLGPGQFRLLGVREDIPRLLAAADLFVFPTAAFPEGLPLASLEPLAAGVPLVTTAISDLPRLLEGVALIVPPGDPDALLQACRTSLGDAPAAAARAARGRALVRERLSVHRAVAQHLAHYRLG